MVAFFATQKVTKSLEHEVVFVDLCQPIIVSAAQRQDKPVPATPAPTVPPLTESSPVSSLQRSVPVQQVIPNVVAANINTHVVAQPRQESTADAVASVPKATTSSITGERRNAVLAINSVDEKRQPDGDMTFGAASAPSFEHRTVPTYPMVARRFGKEGTVILRLSIDEHGNLSGTEVLQDPGYGFAAAAIEAVKQSRFKPAHNKGRPMSAKAILPIRFALQTTN